MNKSRFSYPGAVFTKNEDGKIIAIMAFQSGYQDTTVETDEHCKELNRQLGVTEEERIAMHHGSLFGWDCGGADPRNPMVKMLAANNRRHGEALGL